MLQKQVAAYFSFPLSWRRLHAGRGFTKVRVGDKLFTLSEAEVPNPHKTVSGLTPAHSLDAVFCMLILGLMDIF